MVLLPQRAALSGVQGRDNSAPLQWAGSHPLPVRVGRDLNSDQGHGEGSQLLGPLERACPTEGTLALASDAEWAATGEEQREGRAEGAAWAQPSGRGRSAGAEGESSGEGGDGACGDGQRGSRGRASASPASLLVSSALSLVSLGAFSVSGQAPVPGHFQARARSQGTHLRKLFRAGHCGLPMIPATWE